MRDDDELAEDRFSSGILIFVAGLALLIALGAVAWAYFLQNRLDHVELKVHQVREQAIHNAAAQAETGRQLRATTEAFGEKVGITQRQIESRADEILRQQEAANSRLATRISAQEAATRKQVSHVSSDVSNVRTDVGGVKQQVASTQQELRSTEEQLHAAVGDLGVESGLIAKNAEQLDYLRRLGDRNYFQFTLHKNQPPLAVSSIKLRLRKTDVKHSRYTLEVYSDDAKLEKKNRDLAEPLQFYSGKPPMLFEIVVNAIGRDEVSGYLSTPKNGAHPSAQ